MGFPENFLWGVSASGFQFEMGDSAGQSVDANTDWYVWVHDRANIRRGVVSGDLPEHGVAYWKLYRRDHALARKLGLNTYRIGVEWSRIFPSSTEPIKVHVERASDGKISRIDVDDKILEQLDAAADKKALNHYRSIITDLQNREFKVFLCLNHFTLPLWLHNPITARDSKLKQGPKGWLEEYAIVEFAKYAAYMAWRLGDLVDYWATMNEPMAVCEAGYMFTQSGFPPGVNSFRSFKKAVENMVLAHASAYDLIKRLDTIKADADSPASANVGLIHNVIPVQPFDKMDRRHREAAQFMDNMHNQFFPRAVVHGWMDLNLNGIRERNEVKPYLKQRLDWLGVNYYTRFVVKGRRSLLAHLFMGIRAIPDIVENYGFVCKPKSQSSDGNPTSDMGWEIYPEGLQQALKSMTAYDKPLYVTENGVADAEDRVRPKFIETHLQVLGRVVDEDKLPVKGYFHWALTDNYEWAHGFRMKFGLYAVDLESKTRKKRKSADVYKRIVEAGEV
ncbi:glycoside hydrolase family 1 protein [Candidatus Bathyarchaeota archaeon]|nr:glycoside hydrolase family 1 protein [Candidatus Bathyarchaeota archaeon]